MKWLLFCLLLVSPDLWSQNNASILRSVAFYNLENLFDTIDDPETFDEDYTRNGKNNYTSADYNAKLRLLASVIGRIGSQGSSFGPDILGVSEIENRRVLEDLISQPGLDSLPYAIVHEDSPDVRGIDVALIYREDLFFPIDHESAEVRIWDENGMRIYTRDVLWVHGILDAEEIHLLVNHWPSRRGGAIRSAPKRMKAAHVNQNLIERIRGAQPNAKILVLGDFNDDPTDRSLVAGLGAKTEAEVDSLDLFNPMIRLYRKGHNTLVFRDQIHLFDQILLSKSFLQSDSKKGLKFWGAGIYNPPELHVREGKYRGYPNRSFKNGKYSGGYSDHFPVFVKLFQQ